MSEKATPKKSLRQPVFVCRVVPHNGGLVLAPKPRAELVARIHTALKEARTWAQFRALIPREEYSRILQTIEDERPKGSDPFDAEQVPGYSEGDYPPWLQGEMDRVLPIGTLQRFGTRRDTHLNGTYWHIFPERLGELITHLASLGITVEQRPDLRFY